MYLLSTHKASAIIYATLASLSIPSISIHAQRIPFAAGDIARAVQADSAGQGTWLTGPIILASRDSLLLEVNGVNRLVRFNEATRLQIRRGHRGYSAIGGVLGLLAGAGLGMKSVPPSGIW